MTEPTIPQSQERGPDYYKNRLYVGNIPFSTTRDELRSLFLRAGHVTDVFIHFDRETGRSHGFGFVQMQDGTGKNRAIHTLNSYSLHERALVVNNAWPSNSSRTPWDEFVELARRYVDSGRLDEDEINYKLAVGELGANARTAVLSGADDWIDRIKALVFETYNLITHFQAYPIERWLDARPNDVLEALRILWESSDQLVTERIRAFSELLPKDELRGAGTRMNVISIFLMGLDAEQYPPFRTRWLKETYTRTNYGSPTTDADEAALYEHALGFFDRFIQEADQRGLKLRHKLDAQSVAWSVYQNRPGPKPATVPRDLDSLAADLLLAPSFLKEINALLDEKKQVIFQGPPGVGKTYIAQALARYLAGSEGSVTLVQFHPSYSYEDFVQGFRPVVVSAGNQPGFELRDGPLYRAAERARNEPDENHFLIIDEINRGNLAKVFGELYFLLEYRDSEMDLLYSDKPFSLPPNL